MTFNSRLEGMSKSIEEVFHKWEGVLSKNASELLGLRYMDNRSIDAIHSRNLSVHPVNDSNSQLLYMIKLFYKKGNNNDEYIYFGFRINSVIEEKFNACLQNIIGAENMQDNVSFGGINTFCCINILNTTEDVIIKLIRNYIALALLANNSL